MARKAPIITLDELWFLATHYMVPGKASYLSGNVAGRSSPVTCWATPPDYKKIYFEYGLRNR